MKSSAIFSNIGAVFSNSVWFKESLTPLVATLGLTPKASATKLVTAEGVFLNIRVF